MQHKCNRYYITRLKASLSDIKREIKQHKPVAVSFLSQSSSCSVASTESSIQIGLYDILLNIFPSNILKRFSSVFLIGGTLLYIDTFPSSFLFCLLHPPQLYLSANQDTEDTQAFACPAPVAVYPIFLPCRWWALKAMDPCSLFWAEPGWAPLSKARPPYALQQALLLSLARGGPGFPITGRGTPSLSAMIHVVFKSLLVLPLPWEQFALGDLTTPELLLGNAKSQSAEKRLKNKNQI